MKKSFFVKLFRTLKSKKEIKEFEAHLKRAGKLSLLSIYQYLRKFHPSFKDEKKLDPEYIYKKLYAGKGTADKKKNKRKLILNQVSELHSELNEFLIMRKLKKTPLVYQFLRLEVLKERGLNDRFFRKAAKLEQELEKENEEKPPNIWRDIAKIRLYEQLSAHTGFNNMSEREEVLKKLMATLTTFSLSTGYKFGTALQTQSSLLNNSVSVSLLHPIQLAENGYPSDFTNPLIQAFTLGYRLQVEASTEVFQQLKALIHDPIGKQLAMEDRYALITLLINYCAKKLKNKDYDFIQECFEINEIGLKEKIFIYEGTLSEQKFMNIVVIACALSRFAWARYFITDYQKYLPLNIRFALVHITEATVYLEEGHPARTLLILGSNTFQGAFHNLLAKVLCLRAKYDLGYKYDGDLLNDCRNLKYFLNTNRAIKGSNKKAAINLVQMVTALTRRKKTKEKLREELNRNKPIFYQEWILKKLASYQKF